MGRHMLVQPQPRLVTLPAGEAESVLLRLRAEDFFLVALENSEACAVGQQAPPVLPLWEAPLGQQRLAFLVGSEDTGLPRTMLELCDLQAFIPGAECSLAQEGHNPTLNLAHAAVIALYERRRQLRDQSLQRDVEETSR